MENDYELPKVLNAVEKNDSTEESGLTISRKINLKKQIRLVWLVMAVVFIVITAFAVIRYSEYRQGQETAALFVITADEITAGGNYSKYTDGETYKKEYKNMIRDMYDDYNPDLSWYKFAGIDTTSTRNSLLKVDRALGDLMEVAGFDCFGSSRGSVYFQCVGFVDFVFNFTHIYHIQNCYGIWSIIAVILLADTLWYVGETKKTMLVDVIKVTCRKGRKTKKEFLVKDIKSVESIAIKGLLLRGDNFKYRTRFLENRDELKAYIMELLSSSSEEKGTPAPEMTENSTIGAADELKKYKELLDSGILTQEEFNAKKKQLLGL